MSDLVGNPEDRIGVTVLHDTQQLRSYGDGAFQE